MALTASAETAEPEGKEITRSWVPLAGYNPTYLFFIGGGFFFKKRNQLEAGINGIITQKKAVKIEGSYEVYWSEFWSGKFTSEVGNGYEPNFGTGNRTRAADRVDVPMSKTMNEFSIGYHFTKNFVISPTLDFRGRWEQKMSAFNQAREVSPYEDQEIIGALGFRQELDFRNVRSNPSIGWYQKFTIRLSPEYFQTNPTNPRSFLSTDMDLRTYQPIVSDDLVFAAQASGGFSIGTPTYLHQFRLGGTDELRGYHFNRFRGERFYLQRSELRWKVWKMINLGAFLDVGEVTDRKFSAPAKTTGFGLRIGLPPDYISQIRLDAGFGHDQNGVFLDFGHAF